MHTTTVKARTIGCMVVTADCRSFTIWSGCLIASLGMSPAKRVAASHLTVGNEMPACTMPLRYTHELTHLSVNMVFTCMSWLSITFAFVSLLYLIWNYMWIYTYMRIYVHIYNIYVCIYKHHRWLRSFVYLLCVKSVAISDVSGCGNVDQVYY